MVGYRRPLTSACLLTQTSAKLYLVLDFMNGGHLFFNLYRQGIFDEPQVMVHKRYYSECNCFEHVPATFSPSA